MRINSSLLVVALWLFLPTLVSSQSSTTASEATTATLRRERNIDFLDLDTLAYYLGLDPSTGKQVATTGNEGQPAVAVMFYSQWDRNSHSFAPLWDRIATLLHAGTKKSNLIMGLFDCEATIQNSEFCKSIPTSAGKHYDITKAYPSLIYIFPPGNNKKKKKPQVFNGHWQYGDSVYDWIRTMQMMSGWDKFWHKNDKKGALSGNDLPLGIPSLSSSSNSNILGGSSNKESEIKALTDENTRLTDLVTRASIFVDSLLFPITSPNDKEATGNYSDVFSMLYNHWDDTDNVLNEMLKACAMEVGLDYCERVTTHAVQDLYEELLSPTADSTVTMENIEEKLQLAIQEREPYCAIIENCIRSEYQDVACRPPTCPFNDEVSCRYLTSCLSDYIQEQYAEALGTDLSTLQQQQQQQQPDVQQQEEPAGTKRKGGWFG